MSDLGRVPTLGEVVAGFEARGTLSLSLTECPALIHCGESEFKESPLFDTSAVLEPWDARMALALARNGLTADPDLLAKAGSVHPVAKRLGGPFPDRIGVGRSRTADISLRFGSVSKYHAYFTYDAEAAVWTLWDARSRNGTCVGQKRIPAGEGVPLQNGDHVAFSDQSCLFFTPEGFLTLVKMLAQGAESG